MFLIGKLLETPTVEESDGHTVRTARVQIEPSGRLCKAYVLPFAGGIRFPYKKGQVVLLANVQDAAGSHVYLYILQSFSSDTGAANDNDVVIRGTGGNVVIGGTEESAGTDSIMGFTQASNDIKNLQAQIDALAQDVLAAVPTTQWTTVKNANGAAKGGQESTNALIEAKEAQ